MEPEIPYITLTKHKAEIRPINTMPQELTRYSVSTTQLTVERPGPDVSWGATFVGGCNINHGTELRYLHGTELVHPYSNKNWSHFHSLLKFK